MDRKREVTENEYYKWCENEPLSDCAVDAENVGPKRDWRGRVFPDYWTRMLAAGKSAVAMRKEEKERT